MPFSNLVDGNIPCSSLPIKSKWRFTNGVSYCSREIFQWYFVSKKEVAPGFPRVSPTLRQLGREPGKQLRTTCNTTQNDWILKTNRTKGDKICCLGFAKPAKRRARCVGNGGNEVCAWAAEGQRGCAILSAFVHFVFKSIRSRSPAGVLAGCRKTICPELFSEWFELVFQTSCQTAGGGRVSLYGQPGLGVRQRMTGTANKEDECPRRRTAFRDDAGSRRGARRNEVTWLAWDVFALALPSRFCDGRSCRDATDESPGAAADNRFAPANPIVSRKSGQFPHSGHWLRGAYLRTSLLIFGTGLSRASLKNNGEAFCRPKRSGRCSKQKRVRQGFSRLRARNDSAILPFAARRMGRGALPRTARCRQTYGLHPQIQPSWEIWSISVSGVGCEARVCAPLR